MAGGKAQCRQLKTGQQKDQLDNEDEPIYPSGLFIYATGLSRENWLSPVNQATWEARAVGWLEVEWLITSGNSVSVAALRPPSMRKGNRGGQAPMTKGSQRLQAATL